jgi:hypothetical protein
MRSLYQRILGVSFDRLSPILQRIHNGRTVKRYAGYCDIEGRTTICARFVAFVAGLPSCSSGIAVVVAMDCEDRRERWTREFGSHRMCSSLQLHGRFLRERLGLIECTFELSGREDRIDWRLVSARLWPVPVPIKWLLDCRASEEVIDGRYGFDVTAHVRGIGMIVHYKGWLIES